MRSDKHVVSEFLTRYLAAYELNESQYADLWKHFPGKHRPTAGTVHQWKNARTVPSRDNLDVIAQLGGYENYRELRLLFMEADARDGKI